eukprot:s1005_g45.t1
MIAQRNNLATFLIGEGANMSECSAFIDALLKNAGSTAIGMILSQKQSSKKLEGIVQLARTLHVKLPDVFSKSQKTLKKVHSKFSNVAKGYIDELPVEKLVLQPGFVKNADDSNCCQVAKVTPNSTGVILLKYQDASPWLSAEATLTQDELALAIIGPCQHPVKSQCQSVQLPVALEGEPLIVQACLHNLGAKHVILNVDEHDRIPTQESQTVAFTAYREEMSAEGWVRLTKAPVKVVLQCLLGDHSEINFLTPPWGRSFQDNGKRAQPEHAASFQFHGRIPKTAVREVLRASGTNGIYTTPKGEDKKISDEFRIVWTTTCVVGP